MEPCTLTVNILTWGFKIFSRKVLWLYEWGRWENRTFQESAVHYYDVQLTDIGVLRWENDKACGNSHQLVLPRQFQFMQCTHGWTQTNTIILILVWCILLRLCLTKITSQLPLFSIYLVFTVHNIMGPLKNTWEQFHIHRLTKNNIQLNDAYTDRHNPIFDLIITHYS
jgi:hypothetical protein